MKKSLKIYAWDIETGYNQANIFQLINKHRPIPHSAIQSERYIICAVFKDIESGRFKTVSQIQDKKRFKKDPTDDEYVVREIHQILSESDGAIAHYGDNFDMKFFNTRAIYHGLPPISQVIQIDTYKIARNKFMFNSNSLDYIGKYFGFGGKINVSQQLWEDCINGKQRAVRDMVTYCKQDVDLLEKVYHRLAPYVPAKVNMNTAHDVDCCPLCASENFKKDGKVTLRTGRYQAYRCNDCGHFFRDGSIIKNDRAPLLR